MNKKNCNLNLALVTMRPEIGKKENYTMVIENSQKGLQSRSGILYTDDSLDFSEQVRKEMDKRLAK